MLSLQLILTNLHFILGLAAGLIWFGAAWLYFDARNRQYRWQQLIKSLGFLLGSMGFLIYASGIDWRVYSGPGSTGWIIALGIWLRFLGYGLITFSEAAQPLQDAPAGMNMREVKSRGASTLGAFVLPTAGNVAAFLPMVSLGAAALYWRRATTGLERHLKPIGLSFALAAVFELAALRILFLNSLNPYLAGWSKPYGALWYIEHFFLLASISVLAWWVWRYLTTRLLSQLFITFITVILVASAVITAAFTTRLIANIQSDLQANLETAAGVLDYALEAKRQETLSSAQVAASDPGLVQATAAKNHDQILAAAEGYLIDKRLHELIITGPSGEVLARVSEPDRWGDSISSDPLITRTLLGQTASGFAQQPGALAPQISVRSSVALKAGQTLVGTVTAVLLLDESFTAGVKNDTGLNMAIYGGDQLSAASIDVVGDQQLYGLKTGDRAIKERVIGEGEPLSRSINLGGEVYLANWRPIQDVDNVTIGMLMLGRPQSDVFATAANSLEASFLVAIGLIMASAVPAYLLAKRISREVH